MNHRVELIALAMIATACGGQQKNIDDEKQEELLNETEQVVEVEVVQTAEFHTDIISNGKVAAGSYADVYWESEGHIADVRVSNGQRVIKGDTLARLEAFRLNNTLKTSQSNMEQARLQMMDNLIGQGYEPEADDIPEKVRDIAEIKSGYRNAVASYELAKYEAEHCAVVAPISGIVANLNASTSNKADQSKPMCRIISQTAMNVEFSIIESELPMVAKGAAIEVTAFAMPDRQWTGRVTEVNPFVETNGMVKVKGQISNCAELFEGMNVSVKVNRVVGRYVSVPKTAVVMRSGRPVVFTVKNNEAQWVYIEKGAENSTNIVIESGINEGDSVVVSGNTFLAHKSKVKVIENERINN